MAHGNREKEVDDSLVVAPPRADQRHPLRLHLSATLAFLLSFAVGALLIHFAERGQVLKNQQAAIDIASIHGHLLQEQVSRSLSTTYALAAVLRQGKGEIDNFDELAQDMLRLYGGVSALQLAPGGVIRRIVPLAGNEAAMGHNLLQDSKRNKETRLAIQTRKLTLAGPFKLLQGGVAVVGRLPVFLHTESGEDKFWGFTIALIRISGLLAASRLDPIAEADYAFELSRIHPDTGQRDVFARSSPTPLKDPVSYAIEVPNGRWTLSIAPLAGWHSSPQVLGVEIALVLLVSLLVAALTLHVLKQPYVLGREVALRTRDLSTANRRLELEMVEREHAESALRESETRFRTTADTVPVLIWIAGEDMQLSYVNLTWLRFSGRRLEEEVGHGWRENLHPDDRPLCVEMLNCAGATRQPLQTEFRLRRHDGEYRWLTLNGIARVDPSGDFAGFIGSCIDITDLRQAERVLRASRDELEIRVAARTAEISATNAALKQEIEERKRAEQALHEEKARQLALIRKLEDAQNQLLQSEKMASIGQLAAGVAHEINNPIAFVSSNLASLSKYVDQLLAALANVSEATGFSDLDYLREDLPSLLAETQDGVLRVRKIVRDLKEFSHVNDSDWQFADLHQGLESTINVVWNEIKYKAELVRDYAKLPEVECVGSQINQVFMNLLVNAAQAIDDHGVITIRSGHDNDWAWIEVEDTGKGIPPENLHRVFEPFFTTKPVGKGTGLGLSLSYSIVKKHGGRIDVRSEVDRGTCFRVSLPFTKTAGPENSPGDATTDER